MKKKWLMTIILQYRRMIILMLVIQFGYAILVSLQPMYFQKIVSLAISGSPEILSKGIPIIALLAVIYIAGALLQGLNGYIACIFSSDLLKQLQTDFFEKTGRLPLYFFQHQSAGEFFTKFNHDIGQVQYFIANFIPMALLN